MLKTSIVDRRDQRHIVLEGALTSSSVMQLRTAWLRACAGRQRRRIVLEFRNVTEISPEGEAALWGLINRGATFTSGNLVNKRVLFQNLFCKKPPNSSPGFVVDERALGLEAAVASIN